MRADGQSQGRHTPGLQGLLQRHGLPGGAQPHGAQGMDQGADGTWGWQRLEQQSLIERHSVQRTEAAHGPEQLLDRQRKLVNVCLVTTTGERLSRLP